jgi:hypothetical protein
MFFFEKKNQETFASPPHPTSPAKSRNFAPAPT